MKNEHKHAISRRSFGRGTVGAALAAVVQPGVVAADQEAPVSPTGQAPAASDLSPEQTQEMQARFNDVTRRYGDRLSGDQQGRIRRVLTQNQRMLAPVRAFPIENGDTPATTLKLRVEASPISDSPEENGADSPKKHAK